MSTVAQNHDELIVVPIRNCPNCGMEAGDEDCDYDCPCCGKQFCRCCYVVDPKGSGHYVFCPGCEAKLYFPLRSAG